MHRRALLTSALVLPLLGALRPAQAAGGTFPFALTDEEWRARLSPEAYEVLREEGTEYAFTSPLNDEKRPGIFHCAGCDQPLYDAAHKFDSGTGWPSFWKPLEPAFIGEQRDVSHGMIRIEVHCAVCGGHLGHLFDDGPKPTGMRYCINSASLRFLDAKAYQAWLQSRKAN